MHPTTSMIDKSKGSADVRKFMRVSGVGLALLLFCFPVFAQLNLGRILGGITDQTGGAVVGAMVTILDVARGVSRPLTTDAAGQYSAPGLIPGTYTVRVEAKGFQTAERQNILLGVGQDVRVDVTLQPGEQTQTITVTGEVPLVNTTNATLGGTVENQQLSDLPIRGRQFVKMLDYQPGIYAAPGGDSTGYVSHGARRQDQVWMFDGIDDIDSWSAAGPIAGQQQADILPVDAIQEINVIENPNAQYGWRPGAVVNTGMKSGTNSLHGTVYTYDRNAALDAQNPFLAGQPKTEDTLWNYGASIGGPIKKDKLFYFGNYEGELFSVGFPGTVQVPSSVAGGGSANSLPDAIAAMNAAGHPLSQLSLNLAGCTATGVCDPGKGVMNNSTLGTTVPIPGIDGGHSNSFITKLDYHLNDHNSLNVDYFFGRGDEYTPASIHGYWAEESPQYSQLARGVWIWTPNSAWVNEARFGWDHSSGPTFPAECVDQLGQPNYAAAFGYVPGTQGNPPGCKAFAPVSISSFTSLGSDSGGGSWLFNNPAGVDTVSYTHGKHLFKFGAEFHELLFAGAGKLTNLTGTTTFVGGDAFTGSTPLQDFLAGSPDSGTLLVGSPTRHVTQPRYAAFFQDDWRATARLTVNLGLRYEYLAPLIERDNDVGNFDPNSPSGVVQQTAGHPVYNGDHKNFAPRLGVAWDVTGKGTTVVRAGGGVIYTDMFSYNELFQSSGAQLNAIPTGWTLYAPNGSTTPNAGNIAVGTVNLIPSEDINWQFNQPIFSSAGTALACGNGLGSVNPAAKPNPVTNPSNPAPCTLYALNQNFRTPYTTTWTLGVQHAFTSSLSMNVDYVGTHGTGLEQSVDVNQPSPGIKSSGSAPTSGIEQLRRPYYNQFPYWAQIKVLTDNAEVHYNALDANLTERISHGLTFNAGYTLARDLDDTSGVEDPSLPRLSYGNAITDARNHFTLTGSYDIPGRKSPGQLLEGWQINSEVNLLAAVPFNVVDTTSDISGTGEKQDYWTLLGPASAFKGAGGPGALPCFGVLGSSFAKAGCLTVAAEGNLPAACVTAATNEQYGTTPNPATPGDKNATGLLALANFGCYYENGSAIVPPAQGTYGNMPRNVLRGRPFREWDLSVMKSWVFKERLNTQFRAEIYNLLNSAEYAVPAGNPNSPISFGESSSTPTGLAGLNINGSGRARSIQLGLKFIF